MSIWGWDIINSLMIILWQQPHPRTCKTLEKHLNMVPNFGTGYMYAIMKFNTVLHYFIDQLFAKHVAYGDMYFITCFPFNSNNTLH